MTNRTYTFIAALIGVICGFVIVRSVLFADSLTVRNDLVQGFFVGAGLGVVAVEILARTKATRINGWITFFGCGLPGNGLFRGRVRSDLSRPGERAARGDVLEDGC
jgi:hypothetical protein